MNQLQISERKEILCVTGFNNAERREFYSHICPNHIQSVAVIVTDVVEVVVTVVGLVVVDFVVIVGVGVVVTGVVDVIVTVIVIVVLAMLSLLQLLLPFFFSSNSFLLLPSVMQMRNSSPIPPLRVILWILLFSLST